MHLIGFALENSDRLKPSINGSRSGRLLKKESTVSDVRAGLNATLEKTEDLLEPINLSPAYCSEEATFEIRWRLQE